MKPVFTHCALHVQDLKRSLAFYRDVLGAELYREYQGSVVFSFNGAWLLVVLSIAEAIAGDSQGAASKLANLLLVTLAPPAVVLGTIGALRRRHRVTAWVSSSKP